MSTRRSPPAAGFDTVRLHRPPLRGCTLRPSDVGKLIAIPGGIDLVAIISAPLDPSKDVASVSMTAGSPILTAVLTPQEGFFQPRIHEGLRITVAGAADGGQLLVTDVLRVVDRTTLELALPASTSVPDEPFGS